MWVFLLLVASASEGADPHLAGTADLPGCSGALIRFGKQPLDHPALVLTNGHCLELFRTREVLVDEPWETEIVLYDAEGEPSGTYRSLRTLDGPMLDTDLGVVELEATYRQILDETGVEALVLSPERCVIGERIMIPSGEGGQVMECELDGFVHRLEEDRWSWSDSLRHTEACTTFDGISGSPVLSVETGEIIGVHNTHAAGGEPCTAEHPREIDENGETPFSPGTAYGQQTLDLCSCLDPDFQLDLEQADCALPTPSTCGCSTSGSPNMWLPLFGLVGLCARRSSKPRRRVPSRQ